MPANEPITRGVLLVRHTHHPCRGGWFNKCQTLAYLALTYGPMHNATQECAALYYAGPEPIEPTFDDNDDVEGEEEDEGEEDDEGDGGMEEEGAAEEEGVSYPSCSSTVPGIS